MRQLYQYNSANFPRLKTDVCFADYENQADFQGMIDDAMRFVSKKQLLRKELWNRFVDQFRYDSDLDSGWKGEYWGKMMRGACFVYSYTRDPELYRLLSDTVEDILQTQEENGRISTYSPDHEFEAWDLWCRKYVLLGMQYFMEICTENVMKDKMIVSMCRQADYIISRIGRKEEGKKPITQATCIWRGLNSCSLLEPIVRLYSITKNTRYLNFAKYIVECGGTELANLFELAYEDKLYPYQYPMTKAYEMISCFEGLLEYYRVTGIEKYKQSVIRFADKILESDFTIIGGSGCTHELFDHSTVRQANTTNGAKAQETCVTVTLMKFMYQLQLLTGEAKYVDAFERSLYNAYLGAFNTEGMIENEITKENPDCIPEALPFDSYSPLTAGCRGNGIGGLQMMSDRHYYGCCASIGSAGIGLFMKMALLSMEDGFVMNLYSAGTLTSKTPSGAPISFETKTQYPADGRVIITINLQKTEIFECKFRVPEWSDKTRIAVNNMPYAITGEYVYVNREWNNGDVIELEFDMRTKEVKPVPYGHQILMTKMVWEADCAIPSYDEEDPMAKKHVALRRGPLVLAQDSRLGYDLDKAVEICADSDGYVAASIPKVQIAPYHNIIELAIPLMDGDNMHVTDYASSGKLFSDKSRIAAWISIK